MEFSTRQALLDAAESLTRTRGFNAFSFRDLAEQIGVRTASIHYHFPTKADLGREVMREYRVRFEAGLDEIRETNARPMAQVGAMFRAFEASLRRGGVCLCCPLAAEFGTLPEPVQDEVRLFYTRVEAWLAGTLDRGRRDGSFAFKGAPLSVARSILAALQGAMIASVAMDDESRLAGAISWIESSIKA
jgi:TetR/AcrR family transcriptional repressor of nem operon